jgi:hypothetical protein
MHIHFSRVEWEARYGRARRCRRELAKPTDVSATDTVAERGARAGQHEAPWQAFAVLAIGDFDGSWLFMALASAGAGRAPPVGCESLPRQCGPNVLTRARASAGSGSLQARPFHE